MTCRRHRIATAIVVAGVFGVSMSIIKGNGSGVRDAVGNLSAPWLLLPFAAGALVGRGKAVAGAAVGLAVSIVAMVGFYGSNAAVLDLGPHPWLVDVRLAVEGGRIYLALALLSGPVFGAVGACWQRQYSAALGIAIASLLVFEPFAWMLYERSIGAVLADNPAVWLVEAAFGALGCWFALRGARRMADCS